MKSGALRRGAQVLPGREEASHSASATVAADKGFQPQSVGESRRGNGHADPWLRMYTEEEVSELLQVSLSQLRKWRMKKNQGNGQGPPYKKIGRLVRYPGRGLQAYVNGADADSPTQE